MTFSELLGSELAALGAPDDKAALDGAGDVSLRSAIVQTLSLALHELATNARGYGALASTEGHLTVCREVSAASDGSSRLSVDWRETGIDMIYVGHRPRGGDYGRELIKHGLPYQLGAKTIYEMGLDEVHCIIDIPTSSAIP